MTRFRIALLAGGVVAVLAMSPAFSDQQAVEDAEGDGSGSVDFISASHSHSNVAGGSGFASELGGSVIVHEVKTADAWTFPTDAVEIRMTSRRWRVPRRLFVNANPDGSLSGVVFTRDRFSGYANVYTSDSTTLRLEFPKSLLGKDVRSYRWRVFGTGAGNECSPGVDCEIPPPDRAPDKGSVLHSGLWRYNE